MIFSVEGPIATIRLNRPAEHNRIEPADLDELIAHKRSGAEHGTLEDVDREFYSAEYERLRQELHDAAEASALPEAATCKPALDDLLLRIRGVEN